MKVNPMKSLLTSILLIASTLGAAPIFSLMPTGGAVTALPGGLTGWGFKLTSDDTLYLSVVSSFLLTESNPALGNYSDLIGFVGGPDNFALAPGAPAWEAPFNAQTATGVGYFVVNPNATLGSVNSGLFRLVVETYTDAPLFCGTACLVDTIVFDVPYSVTVGAASNAVPEPATLLLSSAALGALVLLRRRK